MRTTMMVMERKMVRVKVSQLARFLSWESSSFGGEVCEEDYDEEKVMSKDGIIPATGSSSRSLS